MLTTSKEKEVIVTDGNGKQHVCHKAGQTVFEEVFSITSISLEKAVCKAVKKVSIINLNSSQLTVKREPNGNTYLVQIEENFFCFVRPLGQNKFEVSLEDYWVPFKLGSGCKLRAFSDGDITIFWYTTPEEDKASHYYYVRWAK